MKLTSPHYQSAVAMIRVLAEQRGTDYEFSCHASVEMQDDDIDPLDIRNALLRAETAREQNDSGVITYLVHGRDTEQRRIAMVIEVEEFPPSIFVITVWKVTRR